MTNILDYNPWWLCVTRHGVKKVEIDAGKFTGQRLLFCLKRRMIATLREIIVRSILLVERDQLPVLADDEFYWHQLQGLTVIG